MSPAQIELAVTLYRDRGLFLDTNLILLLVVGARDPRAVARHRRTSDYTADDVEILRRFCGLFARLVTLPHVLTEASDLLHSGEEQAVLRSLGIEVWEEQSIASREAAAAPEYAYVGLADAAILERIVGSYFVLTADDKLARAIWARSGHALHFTQLVAAAQ